MLLHPLVTPSNEGTNRCRRGVKNVDFVFGDDSPKPIGFGPIRRSFIHESGRAISQRTVHDVTVTGYPADVGRAPIYVFITKIENVFRGGIDPDQISPGRVEDSLRFTGRTAGVKNVKR